jgi:hypothetical protein
VGSLVFTTTLVKRGPGVAVVLDDRQVESVGDGAKRFPVRAEINGATLRSTVVRMRGEYLLGLNREFRDQAGVEAGDTIELELVLDREPRTVELPADLADALAGDPVAAAAFAALSYTHRREYARWIEDAKRDETRSRRCAETLERLRAGA